MDTHLILVKERGGLVPSGRKVARHPEYVWMEDIATNKWRAKNKETKKMVTVTKRAKGEFVEYEIEE